MPSLHCDASVETACVGRLVIRLTTAGDVTGCGGGGTGSGGGAGAVYLFTRTSGFTFIVLN
jgi:hypothetical protein